jgi:hypothetical protein
MAFQEAEPTLVKITNKYQKKITMLKTFNQMIRRMKTTNLS